MLDFFRNLPDWGKAVLLFSLGIIATIAFSQTYINKDNNSTSTSQNGEITKPKEEYIVVGLSIKNQQKVPLENVKVEFNFTGAPSSKLTDSNGYVQVEIPKRENIKIYLSKDGYKNRNYTLNLLTDRETNKEIELESESFSTESNKPVLTDPLISHLDRIEWGTFRYFFEVEREKIKRMRNSEGDFERLEFIVTATGKPYDPPFYVKIYNSNGIAIGSREIIFKNRGIKSWEKGERAQASIDLPSDFYRAVIEVNKNVPI